MQKEVKTIRTNLADQLKWRNALCHFDNRLSNVSSLSYRVGFLNRSLTAIIQHLDVKKSKYGHTMAQMTAFDVISP